VSRAKQSAIAVMLRQHRKLVAGQISAAILAGHQYGGADEIERERDEQARTDAATARRVGEWRE